MTLVAVVTAFALVIAACGGDDDDASTTTAADATTTTAAGATTTTAAGATTTTAASEDTSTTAAPEAGNTIADIAAGDPNLSTLLAAVQASGLTDALADPNATLTVFAPTDDAFEAALSALDITAEELLANTGLLTGILSYHVLPEVVTSGDLAAAGTEEIPVTTLGGEELIVVVGDAGNVTFRDQTASVTQADVEASNGVIHVIDGVLLPPAAE